MMWHGDRRTRVFSTTLIWLSLRAPRAVQRHATHHVSVCHKLTKLRGRVYVSLACSALLIWINPITDEMVPIRPTSQLGNFPAHRKPGGIQWMALLRSAMLLREENSSARICLWSWEWLLEKNTPLQFRSLTALQFFCNENRTGNTCCHLLLAHVSSVFSSVTSELEGIWRAEVWVATKLPKILH